MPCSLRIFLTGAFALMPVTFSAENQLTTSISEIDFSKMKIYPNPVSENLMIDFGESVNSKIDLFNILSQNVLEQTADEVSSVTMNLSELPEGIYILMIDGIASQKIIVAR